MLSLLRARVQPLVGELGSHKLWSADKKKKIWFLLEYKPRSGNTESYGSSLFTFLGISILFSIVAVPLPVDKDSLSPHPHQHLLSHLFDDSHSDSCEVISQNSFDLHFPNDYRC